MSRHIKIDEAIDRAITNNLPFYAYRHPSQSDIEFGVQTSPVSPYSEGEKGFIFAPFIKSAQYPEIFIRAEYSLDNFPDKISKREVNYPSPNTEIDYEQYTKDVALMIKEMQQEQYQKAVYSRTIGYNVQAHKNLSKWFLRLCEAYPHAYVYIFSYPQVATWMGATPEKLLEYDGSTATTMALAATRSVSEKRDFTLKEENEQQIVVEYISSQIKEAGLHPNVSSRFIKSAGPVEHLCNTISVKGVTKLKAQELISMLHPTPAVAGSPLKTALETITKIEKRSRRYYSGYLGGVESNNTFSLFVNLRSMEIFPDKVQLYVGGGITSRSQVELEWNETVHKSQTLLKIINEQSNDNR